MGAIKMAINPENENIISTITEKINTLIEILLEHQNMDKKDDTFGAFLCNKIDKFFLFSIDCNAAG